MSMPNAYSKSDRPVNRKKSSADYRIRNNGFSVFRGDRLAALMAKNGISQSELARRIGITQSSVWKLLKEPKQGSKHIHAIARVLETTPSFLMGETDDSSGGYIPAPSSAMVVEELGLAPVREIDLNLGMGETYLDVPITETVRHFPREWLRLYTRANPENLVFAQGVGDSMEPTLRDSDLLLIDCSQRHLNTGDKIWAIAYGQSGAVKRLRPLPNGGVAILSDNPNVPDAVAYDGELHLLGRIVAVVRKM